MKKSVQVAFELAKTAAQQRDFTKTHMGCIITYKGLPIATGFNSNKTHPLQKKYNKFRESNMQGEFVPKRHAEINALSKIDTTGMKSNKLCAYIYRIRKDQQFGMARPCPSCMRALKDSGIKHIYYTTNDGYAEEVIL